MTGLGFEIALAACMVAMAGLALWHSIVVRGRRDAATLLFAGVGFGYLFPTIDINLFEQYIFHGQLTFLNLPIHLGLAWYALYYMALCLAERIMGPRATPLRVAVCAGLVFGLLEAQWDPVLLDRGMMELFLPTFASYPLGFNPGIPMCHGLFGFAYAYGYFRLRHCRPAWRMRVILLATLVIYPLGMMASVPLLEPVYAWGGERFGFWTLVGLDVGHLGTAFLVAGFVEVWWFALLANRLCEPKLGGLA